MSGGHDVAQRIAANACESCECSKTGNLKCTDNVFRRGLESAKDLRCNFRNITVSQAGTGIRAGVLLFGFFYVGEMIGRGSFFGYQ